MSAVPGVVLRVLSYNVRALRDDRRAVAEIVRAARPDVVCFQEAPVGPLWRERCSRLAREADLLYVGGGRTAVGNMIAVAAKVDVHGSFDGVLSRTPKLPRRGFSSALLSLGGVRFGVVGVHAGLSAAERPRHAGEVAQLADRLRSAGAVGVVVAGDLNSAPGGRQWSALTATFADAYAVAPGGGELTFPALAPTHRIDAVLVQPPIEVISAGAFDHPAVERASDHRPVLAVLRLPS